MVRLMPRLVPASVALMVISVAPSLAQSTETPPAHVSFTDGTVIVEHDATSEAVEPNTPLLPGDRVRTESGRAEITFGDGSLVHLDEHTTLDLLSDRLVRLLAGRVTLVAGTGLAGQLQLDAAAASVRVLSAGEYRVSLLPRAGSGDLEVAVTRGAAELIGDTASLTVRAGERAVASIGSAITGPWPFNSAQFDAFDTWSQARLDARRGPTSYQHLPPEVQGYAGTFDSYGSWAYQPVYGYVWYPRVDYGWRPYYHGRWKHYRRFGWTWVGGPHWAWPTHHYGRWGITSAGAWFWIPGGHWGAAWVHWGYAPGYVSWCPLGYYNRPVFAFWGGGGKHHHHAWQGWTVVHRSHFGHGRYVRAVALDGQRIANTPGTTFVTRSTPPTFRGTGTRSGRLAADRALPREVAIPHRSGRSAGASSAAVTGAQRAGRTTALGTRSGVARQGGSAPGAEAGARAFRQPASGSVPMRSGRRSGFGVSSTPTDATNLSSEPPARGRQSGVGTAVPRTRGAAERAWRPEDVPIHRGQVPLSAPPSANDLGGPAGDPAIGTVPAPGSRSGPGRWGDGRYAVPRGGAPAYTPPPSAPADGGNGSRRGSFGVPASPTNAAPPPPPPPPPPARADDGGRSAPSGAESSGRAVSRGEGGGGGGGRVGGARRR